MNQLAFSYDADRRRTAMCFLLGKPECFREDFGAWLEENWVLWLAFEGEAAKVWSAGRRHYSANTIIEYLRHQTQLRDSSSEFKFNDRWTSSMARLFAMMNPKMSDIFEFRERANGIVKGFSQSMGCP
jgi:hypothetical protein